MQTRPRFALTTAIVLGLWTAASVPTAYAASIIVNTNADNSTSGDGFCTLREAITNANNEGATSADCPAGTGADTITFAGDYTITLASTLPDIIDRNGLTITGNGPSSTIVQAAASAGTATYRIVRIGILAVVTLESMTLRYGVEASGGAINMQGSTLNLNSMALTDNQVKTTGGSTLNGGALSINAGDVTISNSTISNNSIANTDSDPAHGNGGAIFVSTGSVNINNSTISGNSAKRAGGAFYTSTVNASLHINFSTIANNVSDSDQDSVGNGGGVARSLGAISLKNSILAGNKKGASTDNDCSGTIGSGGYNLTGSGTGCSIAATGDVTVTPGDVFTSVLGPLADNGGLTFTHALFGGNAAQDAVPSGTNDCGNSPFDKDQRGSVRPYNSNCDRGAYEIQAATPTPTMTTTPSATASPTETATETLTPTQTGTVTETPTATDTPTPTLTPTVTFTETATPTSTETWTPTVTPTASATATQTFSPTATPSPTDTPTTAATATSTETPTSVAASCGAAPRLDCRTSGRASLGVSVSATKPTRRRLTWRWTKGSATTADFGNPTTEAVAYNLCVYDDGALRLDAAIGAPCDGTACWTVSEMRRKYRNRATNADGVSQVSMRAGASRASIAVVTKGSNMTSPLPITDSASVVVQFVRTRADETLCWESALPQPARRNTVTAFRDRTP